jgi:hypothetical protein
MKVLGRRAIDGRTRVGKALNLWRKELVDDMGGDENVSVQQKTIIDLIVKQKLILRSLYHEIVFPMRKTPGSRVRIELHVTRR